MWYYTIDNEEFGPVSKDELKQLADDGELDGSCEVWREGMADWVPARQLSGLLSNSVAQPPPRRPDRHNPYSVSDSPYSASDSPGRFRRTGTGEDFDTFTKTFLILDIVFCCIRGLLAIIAATALNGPAAGGLLFLSLGVNSLLVVIGIPAAALLLLRKPIGVWLGRATIGLWTLSIIEAVLSVFLLQVPAMQQQAANQGMDPGAMLVGAIIGGGVTVIIRIALLVCYAIAVTRAARTLEQHPA